MATPQIVRGLLVLLALPSLGLAAQEEPRAMPFPQETSDLKPEPSAIFGQLENGLRYVVKPNREPRDRASLRLLVLAGSLEEKENERGLAHFLEHMAFNGSTHFAPGTLVEFFQRMGMRFGADVNANTTQDRTVYMLELAHADAPTVAEGLRVFGDYAGGLLLQADQVEKERGIIESERRAQDSAFYRSFMAQNEAVLGTTLLPHRMPIGDPDVIRKAQRERFVDFWNAWYRPHRMVVIAVGDFPDSTAVEKMIRENFTALASRGAARPDPALGNVPKFDGIRTFFHAEPEQPAAAVSIVSVRPYAHEADTAARRRERLPRALALKMLNRRLGILSKKENAPFTFGIVGVYEQLDFLSTSVLSLLGKGDQWKAALIMGEQELRRAIKHGFTASELTEATAELRNKLVQDAKTANTRQSDAVANRLVETLVTGEVFTAPADDLALMQPALASVTLDDCAAALRADFGGAGRFIAVTGNVKIEGDAAATIADVYQQSHAVAVTPPTADANLVWGYSEFGKPGELIKREHVADLDVELIEFANGVRLNLKKTPFETGRIHLSASVGNGALTEPAAKRGLVSLAAGAFMAGGLGKHSADDLEKLFAGKNLLWLFMPESGSLVFNGVTTPSDLSLEFEWLAAELTDPGYRPESLSGAQKKFDFTYNMFEHTAIGPIALQVLPLLANGDPRFGEAPREELMARNLDEVKEWLGPQLKKGSLEVAVVGDLDFEATIKAAARTIGALPPRESKPDLSALKKVSYPSKPFTKDFLFDSEIPKGSVVVYWPTDDGLDARRSRRFNLLAGILGDRLRLRVREALGETYSPQVGSETSDTFPGYGYISANIEVDPARAREVAEIIVEVANDLQKQGVTEDEFKRAKEPLLTQVNRSLRDNNYWLYNVLARAREEPQRLEWARNRSADVTSISSSELSSLAARYLGREHASTAIVLPAGAKIAAPASAKPH